jgi:hypothetical protein
MPLCTRNYEYLYILVFLGALEYEGMIVRSYMCICGAFEWFRFLMLKSVTSPPSLLAVLGIELNTSLMLGEHSTTELFS